MSKKTVGIRELKAGLSAYMQRVKAGETLIITERGKPVGSLAPAETSVEDRLQQMIQSGLAAWSGRRLKARQPTARIRSRKTVSDLVLEDRE